MSLWRQLTRGVRVLVTRDAADQDLDEEVRHFYDEAVATHIARGLSPEAARRLARTQFGAAMVIREQVRDQGWESFLTAFASDVRFGGRMLRKSPVFTTVVVLVVALGSGAVTTIFSAMNALLLRPMPAVAEPDRLATLQPVGADGLLLQQGSFREFADLRDRSRTLAGISAWGKVSLTIADRSDATTVWGNMVSGNYFEILGVRPALGRFFVPDEDRTPLAAPVIVVSHDFWRIHLNQDPTAVGRSLLVNGRPFTLIGVAATHFHGVYTGIRADAWVPLMMQPLLRPRANLTTASWLWMFGRLNDGVTSATAERELAALESSRALDERVTKGPAGFRSMRAFPFTGLPGGEGIVMFRFILVLLVAAVGVLLIAGVNIAAMLTARAAARGRELAVRAALGAGRMRLIRQLLTEILLLFAAGAGGGFVLTVLATAALEKLPLTVNMPLQLELSPDLRVFSFAIGTALLTGLIFGVAPAVRAVRRDITTRLRNEAAGRGSHRHLINRTVIVGQLALSLTLLVAAGLFARALMHGHKIDPGFVMSPVVTTTFETESWGYDEARSRAFLGSLRTRVASMPHVAAVSYASRLPLTGGSATETIDVNGESITVYRASVDVGYFDALRISIRQGRAFQPADSDRGPRVAIVNDSLAKRLSRNREVLGRTIVFAGKPTTIVGIAGDAKYATLDESTPPFVYVPLAQVWQPTQSLIVRSDDDAEWLGPAIQHIVPALDPALPRPKVSTLKEATSIVLLPQRAAAIVTGVLGFVGLLLASVGLYGTMAYSVQRRSRELGIRLALGAQRSTVLGMIVREGVALGAIAIVLGLLLAAAGTRLMKGFLFNVSPIDGATMIGMSIVFLLVILVASFLPARRAAISDPLAALRTD